jgi:hypothetical protein
VKASMRKCFLRPLSIGLILALCSCFSNTSPRENFKNMLSSAVNQSIDVDRYSSFCSSLREKVQLKITRLADGNDEYRYSFPIRPDLYKRCTYYCEVNPITRRVVSVRIDDVDNNCEVPPV